MGWFVTCDHFLRSKHFRKKNNKQAWNCLDNLIILYTTAAETNNLHVILKCEFYLTENEDLTCFANVCLNSKVLDMTDNQKLIMSYDTIKHKAIILTGYFKDKFRDCSSLAMEDEKNTMYSEFLQNLCWRGLALIKLLTVHFA